MMRRRPIIALERKCFRTTAEPDCRRQKVSGAGVEQWDRGGRFMTRDEKERFGWQAGWLAALSGTLAPLGFGAALEGYSQLLHPLALLGARGVPHAPAFNLIGFGATGLFAALAAMGLRGRLPADVAGSARIGARLLLLSAVAFAAQGAVALEPRDLDGPGSRWHATAWTLWWIAGSSGALLLAGGMLRRRGWRTFAWAALAASVLLGGLSLSPPGNWPAGIAQRIALCAWLGLFLLARDNGTTSAGERRPPLARPVA